MIFEFVKILAKIAIGIPVSMSVKLDLDQLVHLSFLWPLLSDIIHSINKKCKFRPGSETGAIKLGQPAIIILCAERLGERSFVFNLHYLFCSILIANSCNALYRLTLYNNLEYPMVELAAQISIILCPLPLEDTSYFLSIFLFRFISFYVAFIFRLNYSRFLPLFQSSFYPTYISLFQSIIVHYIHTYTYIHV
jgi:hypothetical protein